MTGNIINKNIENIRGSFLIPKSTTGQPGSEFWYYFIKKQQKYANKFTK